MYRHAYVLLQTTFGRGATRQFPVRQLQSYQCETALDKDADSFNISIGDPFGEFLYLTDRDVEARATIYLEGETGKTYPIFTGVVDDIVFGTEDMSHSLSGRDLSALAIDSDMPPGKWKHVKPKPFLQQRAHKLGLTNTAIHSMREIGTLRSDASETEWEFWYRVARSRDMFMWTGPLGALYIRQLNNSSKATYFFGKPAKGDTRGVWDMPEAVAVHTNKQRKAEVWVYGEDQKKHNVFYAKSIDKTIKNWRRKPLSIMTSSTARSNKEAHEDADEEVYESIVGAYQIELVLHDRGQVYKQNEMARLHLPMPLMHLNGLYFVVGVTRVGGPDGFTQIVRLRERGFAVTKRVPDAPTVKQPKDPIDTKTPAGVQTILGMATTPDGRPLPWADAFQLAAKEWGSDKGWDYATFLAVLLAICEHESNFYNIRNIKDGFINRKVWQPYEKFKQSHGPFGVQAETPEGSHVGPGTAKEVRELYAKTFANGQHNPLAPWYPSSETAVGPMQLVSLDYKHWADDYGWNGSPKRDELEGGRWNPKSNIRAAARALADKLDNPPAADPNNPDSIYSGVARYYGSRDPDANESYKNTIKAMVKDHWLSVAQTSVAAAETLPAGTQTKTTINGVTYEAPSNTPDVVKKAVNWALRHNGDRYEWGGAGPYYDCSSFVTKAYAQASPFLKEVLDDPVPSPKHHGETTFTLYRKESNGKSRFPVIAKNDLLVGDLVFFDHGDSLPQHVGLYLGDGQMISAASAKSGVYVVTINSGYYGDRYLGARRLVDWKTAKVTHDPASPGTKPTKPEPGTGGGGATADAKKIIIQAGHDVGTHSDQPYGHATQGGAAGEAAFTVEVRDKILAIFDLDLRFKTVKATSWEPSAGPSADQTDDISVDGDLFVSLHYDRGTGGSGFFFGYTRGEIDSRDKSMSESSAKLADNIAKFYGAISGAPTRLPDNQGFGGTPSGATGWGYYAWGSGLRAFPDSVNRLYPTPVAVIIECGRQDDGTFLDAKRQGIAKAIYQGICSYYGMKSIYEP